MCLKVTIVYLGVFGKINLYIYLAIHFQAPSTYLHQAFERRTSRLSKSYVDLLFWTTHIRIFQGADAKWHVIRYVLHGGQQPSVLDFRGLRWGVFSPVLRGNTQKEGICGVHHEICN